MDLTLYKGKRQLNPEKKEKFFKVITEDLTIKLMFQFLHLASVGHKELCLFESQGYRQKMKHLGPNAFFLVDKL